MYIVTRDGVAPRDARTDILDQVITAAVEIDNVDPISANKLRAVFEGNNAPMVIRFPRIHIANLTAVAFEKLGALVDSIKGYLEVKPQNREAYKIELDENADQTAYLVAVERFGTATESGSSTFWSYALVIPQTVGENSQALVLAVDLGFDGKTYKLEFASRLYTSFVRTTANGPATRKNRLATLENLQNMEGVMTAVMVAEKFPYESARKNRETPEERRERFRNVQPGVSAPTSSSYQDAPPPRELAPAGAGSDEPYNPWQDNLS
jgi:hypothetical protein